MTQVLEGPHQYLAEFERAGQARADAGPAWLRDLRLRALDRFGDLGFPTTRDEEWKFTSVAPIADTAFTLAGDGLGGASDDLIRPFASGTPKNALVFMNGRYALSTIAALPPGTLATDFGSALATDPGTIEGHLASLARYQDHAFTALNTAFIEDGAFVSIPAHAIVDEPIQLLFLSSAPVSPTVSHPRVLIVAGEDSQVRIVERYVGPRDQTYWTNAVTEIVLGANAVVDHYKVQREGLRGFHTASMHVRGRRSANLSSHSLSLGGALVRNEVTAVLAGEGIDCTLNGLYLADGRQLVDNHTTIDHATPHCASHEVYKGVLGGRARAVFNGKIIVRPDAQKTDAKQTNRALLLSDDARINTKPQLEIFANDVRCTHGATVGQLDEDAIFYLRARGLGYDEARAMLIRAFAGDILNRIKIEPLRVELETALLARLPQASGSSRAHEN